MCRAPLPRVPNDELSSFGCRSFVCYRFLLPHMLSTVARIVAAVRITAVVRVPTTVVDTTQTRMAVITREKRTHTNKN